MVYCFGIFRFHLLTKKRSKRSKWFDADPKRANVQASLDHTTIQQKRHPSSYSTMRQSPRLASSLVVYLASPHHLNDSSIGRRSTTRTLTRSVPSPFDSPWNRAAQRCGAGYGRAPSAAFLLLRQIVSMLAVRLSPNPPHPSDIPFSQTCYDGSSSDQRF